MSFAVVEFDDETVDVIPTNWCISETCCYWAPYRGLRFTSAVRKQEEPQQTWTQCVMRVLHHYDDYSIARRKLSRAEDTSTLETDAETNDKKSRPKRKPMQFIDEAYVDQVSVKVRKNKASKSVPLPPVPPSLQYPMLLSSVQEDCELPAVSNDVCQTIVRHSPRKENTGQSTMPEIARDTSPQVVTSCNNSPATVSLVTPSVHLLPTRKSPRKVVNPLPAELHTTPQRFSTGTDSRLVLSKLALIEQQQRHNTQLLQCILTAMQRSDDSCEPPAGVELPVNNMKELNALEGKLDDDGTARQLVRYLGAIGGKDVPETTRRIMSNIMTTAVARQMNFAGRGGKVAIQNMKLLRVIIGAVRRNRILKQATRTEIENTAKLWLRYSYDRAGGREMRRSTNESVQNTSSADPDYSDVE